MAQLILGSSHVIPQAAVLDCDPSLVGDALSVHLAQQSNSAAVWTLHVWVLITQGWYHLGVMNTTPPSAGSEPSRTVLVATCPGATGWRVECECTTDDEIANIALQSSKCCSSSIGVTPITPGGGGGVENVNIVASIPLTVNATIVGPDPLNVNIVSPVPVPTLEGDNPWSNTFSTALAASFVIRAAPGILRSVTAVVDGAVASGTYYLQLWDQAAVPVEGTAVTLANSLASPVKIVHVLGTDDTVRYDFDEYGVDMDFGGSLNLSTTRFTKTILAGSNLAVTSAEYR
jgi:hypothetical protein